MLKPTCVVSWRLCLVAGLLTAGIATVAPSLGHAQNPAPCTPPPGPAPPGGMLCQAGTGVIKGTTGCALAPFRVVVRGLQIQSVVFRLDGNVVKTLTAPNRGALYVLRVNPRKLSTGVHRVLARIVFLPQSGTRARMLRVVFGRCVRGGATSPSFTG